MSDFGIWSGAGYMDDLGWHREDMRKDINFRVVGGYVVVSPLNPKP